MAIFCFIPDYGHLQPLLKVADALSEAGYDIRCYIAPECAPLMKRFRFDWVGIDSAASKKNEGKMTQIFSKSVFFNSVCLYAHYLFMYPRVTAAAGGGVDRLSRELSAQKPDLIISDALWYVDWYARIAQSHGIPLIINSFDGSLAYNQRDFVRTYGLTTIPNAIQSLVEITSTVSRFACEGFHRLRYFGQWLSLRRVRSDTARKFERAFPTGDRQAARLQWIVFGTARIERERLASALRLEGADQREFHALRFRSQLPIPDELLEWLRSDENAPVVYVSFGSAVDLDRRFLQSVYDGLCQVPARILWSLPLNQQRLLLRNRSGNNIRFESFVPQPEILSLPCVRCFVTQGGPHSIQEAIFGATPMLCIPFFVDQAYNGSVVERLHIGKRLWRRNVSAASISRLITGILNNKEYQGVVEDIRSDLLRDEGGMAIVEYVNSLLNQGATGQFKQDSMERSLGA